jgi:sugar phosphate isomerase/epimerase
MDTTELRAAYAAFLDLARKGSFGSPDQGWDARHVIAHVAANDEMLAATTQEVIDRSSAEPYYNHDAIDTARLTALIGDRDVPALADWAQATSERVCDLAEALSEDDGVVVHTHIQDGDETRLDQPIPWHRLIAAQARRHLPAHMEQLQALTVAQPPAPSP